MNNSDWLRGYFQDLFMSDATEGLSPWDENGDPLESYIDDTSGAYVMFLQDDELNEYELRVTPL